MKVTLENNVLSLRPEDNHDFFLLGVIRGAGVVTTEAIGKSDNVNGGTRLVELAITMDELYRVLQGKENGQK